VKCFRLYTLPPPGGGFERIEAKGLKEKKTAFQKNGQPGMQTLFLGPGSRGGKQERVVCGRGLWLGKMFSRTSLKKLKRIPKAAINIKKMPQENKERSERKR